MQAEGPGFDPLMCPPMRKETMFKLLSNVLKATVAVAVTPVMVVADFATIGDNKGSHTGKTLRSAVRNLQEAVE